MEIMDPMPAVAAVLAVLAIALWWLRKKGAIRFPRAGVRRHGRRLESMDRLALSPNHALHLVRLDDRAILVAQSPAGLVLLDGTAAPAAGIAAAERA
jgi:hypothetical protein